MTGSPPLVEAVADELYKCNRCGFCQTRCPIYRTTGLEASVARGHFARLQAVLEGELPFDDSLRPAAFACLMCRACTAECPPGIQTDRIIAAARASFVGRRQSRVQRFIFRRLLPNPALMRTLVRALAILKRTRLTAFARLLRLAPGVDPGLAEAPAMMPAPGAFLRDRLSRRQPLPTTGRKVIYFLGCGIDYTLPEVGAASVEVLEALGNEVMVAPNVCCGLPPYSYGDLEAARALARKNVAALAALEGEAIITDCGSCASFLRDYASLFAPADPARAKAEYVAGRVREFSEFAAAAPAQAFGPVQAVVTYHDPCHLSRYHKVTAEPRDLLRRIPELEYREMPEADWCCGGAGSYALSHYELSMAVLQRKMENIGATGASIVATSCPACITQLRYGARRFGPRVEVMHLSQLLRQSLAHTSSLGATPS